MPALSFFFCRDIFSSPMDAPRPPGELRDESVAARWLAFVDRHRWGLLALLVGFYLAGFNGQWRIEPDSALYLTIGRNLARGEGYVYHGQVNRLAYPGLPLLIAGCFKLFGIDRIAPVLAAMLAIAFACLGLVFRLIRLHADRPTAVMVTLGVGIMTLFHRCAFQVRNDMPFLLGVLLFLCGYEAIQQSRIKAGHVWRWWDIAAMIAGLLIAVVFRPAMYAFIGAIGIVFFARLVLRQFNWRRMLLAMLPVVALAGFFLLDPRLGNSDRRLGDYEAPLLHSLARDPAGEAYRIFVTNLTELLTPLTPETLFGTELGWWGLNILFGIAALAAGVATIRRRTLWGVWVLATIAMMLVAPSVIDRYLLPIVPILSYGWWRFMAWISRRQPRRWASAAFWTLLTISTIPNMLKLGAFTLDQRRPQFLAGYSEGSWTGLVALGRAMSGLIPPDGWVLSPYKRARVLSYLSDRRVAEQLDPPGADVSIDRLYVIEPADQSLQQLMRRLGVRAGAELLSVEVPAPPGGWFGYSARPRRDLPPQRWSLHRAIAAEAPAPAATVQAGSVVPIVIMPAAPSAAAPGASSAAMPGAPSAAAPPVAPMPPTATTRPAGTARERRP